MHKKEKKILGLIGARSGSKGVPDKNINFVVNGVNLGLTFRNQFKALADKNDENIDAIISQWKSDAKIY